MVPPWSGLSISYSGSQTGGFRAARELEGSRSRSARKPTFHCYFLVVVEVFLLAAFLAIEPFFAPLCMDFAGQLQRAA
jgi:hypothetical protein